MLIRSQDKEILLKAERIEIINNKVCECITSFQSIKLGEYDCKERAISVLNDIQYAILNNIPLYEMPSK